MNDYAAVAATPLFAHEPMKVIFWAGHFLAFYLTASAAIAVLGRRMMNFLRTAIEGFENARLLSTALQIGIRESRRVMGEYVLCEEDLVSLARFDDAIAVSNYAIDIHNPNGTGTVWREFGDGEWYEIPYRCLVPLGMNNLLVAGRCISSTHEAQASYRIMPFCAELGQAAGCAAAVAKKNGTSVRALDVSEVRRLLREEGFVI
jgi:hypothetical protein